MTLFDWNRQQRTESEAPLAARMRPRTLDEFVGQDEIVGAGRLLRRAIQADQLSSLIFYGPPGTGKTTLARIIANTTEANFISINAVLAGVKDIREAIAGAKDARGMHGRRTILFIDEVHRFNKAQQDALLPWVENGTVILIGATTENPYFEVNKALVSRSRLFQLRSLNEYDLRRVTQSALTDPERGFGSKDVRIASDALDHLVNVANGDARALLNALELAVDTTPEDDSGAIHIDLSVAEESIQRRAVLYDKEGDAHFDTISAFIKSCRGSDPDAALYWLARMVYAGEDPRYIFRRMLIVASEDVGLADPDALVRVQACAAAFDRIGMPEGRYHLSQATLVLATAAKSNSTMGFFDALSAVGKEREGEVPNHLKDATRDAEGFGHGAGYLYPHAYRDHWVAQQYLPTALQGQVFYQPSDRGFEARIREEVARQRESQLAAAIDGTGPNPLGLTHGPPDAAVERWLRRTLEDTGRRLAEVRDAVFVAANVQRHHVVAEIGATSGLLTWEAVRRAPEGGVLAVVVDAERGETFAVALEEQAAALPELTRPQVVAAAPDDLAGALGDVRPDVVMGLDFLLRAKDRSATAAAVHAIAGDAGWVVLAETLPRRNQRLYDLVEAGDLEPDLRARWADAEEAIYRDTDDPSVDWDLDNAVGALEAAGFTVEADVLATEQVVRVTRPVFERWWNGTGRRASYRQRLLESLSPEEVDRIAAFTTRHWLEHTVRWRTTTGILRAHPG